MGSQTMPTFIATFIFNMLHIQMLHVFCRAFANTFVQILLKMLQKSSVALKKNHKYILEIQNGDLVRHVLYQGKMWNDQFLMYAKYSNI